MSEVVEDVAVSVKSGSTEAVIPPWDQLRKAREKQNLNPADVAKELKLDLRFVNALEGGNIDELPDPVYTAGYIRAYAKLVGLSPDKVVADYTSQDAIRSPELSPIKEKIPARYRAVQNELPKSFIVSKVHAEHRRKVRIVLGVLAVLIGIFAAWKITLRMFDSGSSDAVNNTETKTLSLPSHSGDSTPEMPQLQPPSSGAAIQSNEQQQLTESLQGNAKRLASISLSYTKKSWVDIRDANGKPLIRRLGTPGESNVVKGEAPFEVLLGYSPGVSLEYNGEPYDLTRFHKGAVARFILGGNGDSNKRTSNRSNNRIKSKNADKAKTYVPQDD